MQHIIDRFISYVTVDTESDPNSDTTPSTAKQWDLVISEVKPSCGCTVPDYTKTSIKPGATGEIKVTFDSKGKSGNVSKTVTVTMNTETPTETLKFTANIEGGKSGTVAKTK